MSDANKQIEPKNLRKLKTRGKGLGKDYEPFIKVHELSSQGESVRVRSATVGRIHHLLSGIEQSAFLIFDQCSRTVDIREQFPIQIEDSLSICSQLGIRHPQVKGELTVVTTDLLIDFNDSKQLAVAVKPSDKLSNKRTIDKLQIEKAYWESKGVEWALFTELEVSDGLRENMDWLRPYLDEEVPKEFQLTLSDIDDIIIRLIEHPREKVCKLCGRFDDKYQMEPGHHMSALRYAIAHKFLQAPIDRPFHSWVCSELSLIKSNEPRKVKNAS